MMADNRDPEDMTPRPSAAEIAALIDGRLSDDARAALMRRLGESEEDLDVALDAAAAVSDLNKGRAESTPVSNIAMQRRKRFRGITFATVSLAAAAVAVIVLRTPGTNAEGASEMVSALSSHEALPADWNYSPWPAQRGEESVSDSSLMIRIGARATDLEFSLRARDTTAARVARDISVMLDGVSGGSAVGAIYEQLAGNPESSSLLTEARRGLASLPRQDLIARGAWLEAARIAASRQDRQWFKREANQHMMQKLVDLKKISRTDAESVRESINHAAKWSRLLEAIETLLRE